MMVSKKTKSTLLHSDRNELFNRLLDQEGIQFDNHFQIKPRNNPDEYPLSFAQKRLWFMQKMVEENPVYNIPLPLRLHGPIDIEELSHSLNQILIRHDVLRASFLEKNGEPIQIVHPPETIAFSVTESLLGSSSLDDVIKHEASRPFNLKQAPLMRAKLFKLDKHDHVLMLTLHHIVADGGSYRILLNELARFYNNDETSNYILDLNIQYADFAAWEKEQLTSLNDQLQYWKNHLNNLPEKLQLVTDFNRPAIQSFRGELRRLILSRELTSSLHSLSSNYGVTLFVTLLSVFKLLLTRYTSQFDIVVGIPISNKSHKEVENLIGLFINTLAIRTQLSCEQDFVNLLETVSKNVLYGLENKDYPFDLLVDHIDTKRNSFSSPLFQVMFNFQPTDTAGDNFKISDIKVENLPQPSGIAKFDLTLHIEEVDNKLHLAMEYATDLFLGQTIDDMLSYYQCLLTQVVANPRHSLDDFQLIYKQDQEKQLTKWCQASTTVSDYQCLHELFHQQVEKTPDKIAVSFNDKNITYRELNYKSHKLALKLQKHAIEPGSLVGLCVERSIEMVIGILGILKAGFAYVPIDPSYPMQRIRFILRDSQAALVITESMLAEKLDDIFTNHIVILLDVEYKDNQNKTLNNKVDCHNLAYVVYTSGSTGKPKGTMITHASVLRICKYPNYIDIKPKDVILQLSSYAFDGSIFDIFSALLNGAELVLIDKSDILHIDTLLQYIQLKGITVFFVTTALFNSLIDTSTLALSGVRKILFGGERASVNHVNKALNALGKNRLVHVYGPTEATVFSSFYPVNEPINTMYVPIGKPVTDTGLYVLDQNGNLQPKRVPGELYISGQGLAEGYLNQPELTDIVFVNNPFKTGTKLYKTGDYVRWNDDGYLEFIGRLDKQIKIRGFRIELGEIESSILEQSVIKDVAVVDKIINDSLQLVAYYVAENTTVDTDELRRSLLSKLPEVMIPSIYIALDHIPLTHNGKIDRRLLQEKEVSITCTHNRVLPRNIFEKEVANIWKDILEVDDIGVYDDFFQLGGHSLLITKILSKIQDQFGVKISIQSFINIPTIANTVALIKERTDNRSTRQHDPIKGIDRAKYTENIITDIENMSEVDVLRLLDELSMKESMD